MSDTPRTDAVEYEMWQSQVGSRMRKCKDGGWVVSDFARELERENAELRKDKERLDWLTGDSLSGKWKAVMYQYDCRTLANGNLRAAIDAARAKEAQP